MRPIRAIRGVFGLIAAVALSLLAPSPARADGFIIINDPPPQPTPGHFAFAPLEVTYHRVTVDINDRVAVTTVDQEFHNPNNQRMEGTYLFPLPAGAHIDKFEMDINGQLMQAELLEADKARSIYEEIVRQYKDPALLEYMGRDAFKARIFPIEPNSKKQIKITYTELLDTDTGLVEYTYPLNTEKFSARPLNDVSVKINLTCKEPIKAVYCPSHNVEIKRDGDLKAVIGYEEKNVRPDTDFKLIFSRTEQPVSVDLLTYRNSPDDGYFLLLASPGLQATNQQIQKRDICFVFDTSGSMAEEGGKKMEQAKKALSFCLQNLNEGDRFEIVRFSTEAEYFFNELKDATPENVNKALAYVQSLKPIGGTAIQDALDKALKVNRGAVANDRPYVVIFLTDGQPTIGETNEDTLIAKVKTANTANTKIFSFGIGTDINTHLLDRVAADSHAFSQYVLPQEDIEVKLSSFYTKIKEPVLSNVQLAFEGGNAQVTQIYPNAMPDLFKGESLTVFGRYTGKGPAAVKITGTINGETKTFVTDVNFTEHDVAPQYIPRLWATRRVGWLLDEIRLRGESAELKDEVTRLAREHGIVTPYTAYLILEDERQRGVPLARQNMRELGEDEVVRLEADEALGQVRAEARNRAARAGEAAVDVADDLASLKDSDSEAEVREVGKKLAKSGGARGPAGDDDGGADGSGEFAAADPSAPAAERNYGYKEAQDYGQQARVVNGRSFFQNGTVWTDSTAQAQADLKQVEVAFNSDEYFDLLAEHPEAAQWLALGNEVDVVLGDTLYVIR